MNSKIKDVTNDGCEVAAARRPELHWWIGIDLNAKHVVVLHYTIDGTFRSEETREFGPDSLDDAIDRARAAVHSAIRAVS